MSGFSSQAGFGGIQPISAGVTAVAAAAHATRPDRDRQQKQQQKPPPPKQVKSDEVTTSPEAVAAMSAANPDAQGHAHDQSHHQSHGRPHPNPSSGHTEPGSFRPTPVELPHLDIQG